MDLNLTSEQVMLVDTVRKFVERELLPLEEGIEEKGRLEPDLARALFEKSRANGMYAMNIPEEFGGGGLSALDTMLVEEQFGHAKDILIRRAFGNVYEVLLGANDAQRDRWLLPTVRGERTCSIAITEPGAGSDAAAIRTRAVRREGGWTLTGGKHFISDGEFSDFFIVSAVTDPEAGARGISLEGRTCVIFQVSVPAGALISTESPTFLLSNELPTGDSLLILPSFGFASVTPTIV